ncbi:FAD-dependent monooxygenase [Actinocrinis sp.]|uniref:FAD-dependent monooxygenase n=1 Tax=Actinocrinis sp. TaxID=1920516 RepID=UPI002C6D7366|nr:FAD-dependent monooxygenase [Actinocrinis sp.]HXR70901.1 FAD-dependent monooxygenase [Actinocrinis sp.]
MAETVYSDQEVVIVGAGPTGLLLAGDLAARGVACTVLERRVGPPDTTTTRAFAVHARTLEQLDARGLADRLIETGTTVDGLRLYGKVSISFAQLPSRFPYLLVTPQFNVERLLEERAVAAGARVVRGVSVVGLSQDAEGVSVHAQESESGDEIEYRAKYVVGTDGVHSIVRNALGLPYPGQPVVRSLMLADVRFAEPPTDVLTVAAVGDVFAFVAPFGDGWYRTFCWNRDHQVPPSAPLELSEVREVLERAFGTDFGLAEARWMSRFQSDERQVPEYRVGRVFLAGDAAHCHSPAGGQGMNTGIQDAANLGWKLAAVLNGRTADPERLLDSYHAERHPVGRQVLRSSGALVRLALIKSLAARTARDVLSSAAVRVPAIAHRATDTVSGIGIDYGKVPSFNPEPDAHPAPGIGKRIGDVNLTGGRLYEQLRDGRFVLIGQSADDARIVDGWKDDVTYAVSAEAQHALQLVRPDGYVAWASDEADPAARASAVRKALTVWCGESR